MRDTKWECRKKPPNTNITEDANGERKLKYLRSVITRVFKVSRIGVEKEANDKNKGNAGNLL